MLLMNTGKSLIEIPYGLAVRIPGFHPGGPGSTPGMGKTIVVFTIIFNHNNDNNNNINNNNDNGDDNDNGKDKLLKYFINFNIIFQDNRQFAFYFLYNLSISRVCFQV